MAKLFLELFALFYVLFHSSREKTVDVIRFPELYVEKWAIEFLCRFFCYSSKLWHIVTYKSVQIYLYVENVH